MTINMLRHGESTFNKMGLIQGHSEKSVLTELGKKQIRKVTSLISHKIFDCVYYSDLKRTIQSWDILSEYIITEKIIKAPDLREQNQGLFEGMPYNNKDFQTLKQHEQLNDKIYKYLISKYKAETFISFKERVEKFLKTIPDNKEILLITHGGVIGLKNKETNTENGKIYLINNKI